MHRRFIKDISKMHTMLCYHSKWWLPPSWMPDLYYWTNYHLIKWKHCDLNLEHIDHVKICTVTKIQDGGGFLLTILPAFTIEPCTGRAAREQGLKYRKGKLANLYFVQLVSVNK